MAISDKLTYLNETKTKLKTAINNLGGTITSNDTFRSYVNALDNIYKYLPKVSGEDTIINLDNTIGAKMKVQLKGNTSQDGTPTPSNPIEVETITGLQYINVANAINIFDMKEYANNNSSYFTYSRTTGLTAIAKDNRATTNVGYPISITPNTKYYVKTDTDKRLLIAQYNSNGGWITNNEVFNDGSFTTNANTSYLRIKVADTLTTFPTLIGNVYISTSNNYQSNIYEINLGKNLFDKNNINKINAYFENNGTIISNNYNRVFYIACKPNTKYGITQGNSTLSNHLLQVATTNDLPQVGINVYDFQNIGTNTAYTYTTNSAAKYLVFRIRSGDDLESYWNSIQIEVGNPTSYSPYFEPIELCKIRDYQDYIFKNNGKWYLHKGIEKVVLNGSENWNLFFSTNGIFINNTLISSLNVASTINCISNYFPATTRANIRNNLASIDNVCATNGGELIFANKNITSANDFKNWLISNNVILYYILATATDTEITNTELINQLETLNNSYSYKGQTNISQENSDLPIIIYASTLMGNVEA